MIIKILGVLDIFAGVVFWLFGIFSLVPASFVLLSGLFLIVKGIVFITGLNIISILDIVSGFIIITAVGSSFAMPKIIVIIVSLFLIQKGIFSLFG